MLLGVFLLLLLGVASAQECSDASNCLDEWKEFCSDGDYSLFMSTKCPKLCGLCDKERPQVSISNVAVETEIKVTMECNAEDAYTECVEWKDHCFPEAVHFDWMKENCKKVCNICPGEERKEEEEEKKDEEDQDEGSEHECMDLNRQRCMTASRYDCQVGSKNYDWMSENCPETCGFCDGIPCKNRFNHCIEEYRPFCSRDHPKYSKMVNLCADFCGFCQDGQMIDPEEGFWDSDRTALPDERRTEDENTPEENQKEERKRRRKQRRKDRKNKRKNNQNREEEEEKVMRAELECESVKNTFSECDEFKDECHPDALHFPWMKKNCAETCNICESKEEKGTEEEDETEEEKGRKEERQKEEGDEEWGEEEDNIECKNLYGKKCNQVSRYYCQFGTKYYDWMLFNCPETCGFCDGVTCKNRYSHCVEEYRPFCSRDHPNYITMVNLCADFCGFCKDGQMIDPEEGFPESKRNQRQKGRKNGRKNNREDYSYDDEEVIIRSDLTDSRIPPEALEEMNNVAHHEEGHEADEFEVPPEDRESTPEEDELSPDIPDTPDDEKDGDEASEEKKKKRGRKGRKQRRKNKKGKRKGKRKGRKNKKNKKKEDESEDVPEDEEVPEDVPEDVPEEEEVPEDVPEEEEVPEDVPEEEEVPEDMPEEITEEVPQDVPEETTEPPEVRAAAGTSECQDDETCQADWKHHCTVESNFFGYMQTYCPKTCGFCT